MLHFNRSQLQVLDVEAIQDSPVQVDPMYTECQAPTNNLCKRCLATTSGILVGKSSKFVHVLFQQQAAARKVSLIILFLLVADFLRSLGDECYTTVT